MAATWLRSTPATEPLSRNYDQSLSVLDTQTGALADFPDARTGLRAPQTLFSGVAFSRDGRHIYASMAALRKPTGDGDKAVGNAIAVYSFSAGKIAPERLIPLPMQQLAAGRKTRLPAGKESATRLFLIPLPLP